MRVLCSLPPQGAAGVGRPLTYLLPDLQRPLAQGLRLLVFSSLPVQDGQVVEGGGHLTENKGRHSS